MAMSVNGRQEEAQPKRGFGLKDLLKGEDPRMIAFLKRQIPLLLLVMALLLIYIGNRYDSQCDQILIEDLKTQISQLQYQALNTTSDVSAKSKPSYIEEMVSRSASGLESTNEPPYRLQRK